MLLASLLLWFIRLIKIYHPIRHTGFLFVYTFNWCKMTTFWRFKMVSTDFWANIYVQFLCCLMQIVTYTQIWTYNIGSWILMMHCSASMTKCGIQNHKLCFRNGFLSVSFVDWTAYWVSFCWTGIKLSATFDFTNQSVSFEFFPP